MWIYTFERPEEIALPRISPLLSSVDFSRSTHGAWRTFHTHEEYHLMFCTKGSGMLRINDTDIALHEGKLALIPAGYHHSCGASREGMEFWGLAFLPGGEEDPLGSAFVNSLSYAADFSGYLEYVKGAFLLIHEYGQKDSDRGLSDEAIRSQVLSLLYLGRTLLREHPYKEETPQNHPMLKVLHWIIDHYAEDISLSILAREFSMSSSHLSRSFFSAFHISPINFLIDYRITVAKDELLHTDKTIHQIAEEVGYDNTYHFTNLFTKRTGFSPAEMRRHMRDGTTQPVPPRFRGVPARPETDSEQLARRASEQIGSDSASSTAESAQTAPHRLMPEDVTQTDLGDTIREAERSENPLP